MAESISLAKSVTMRVFAFRYAGYGGVVGRDLLLFRRSIAAFIFVARSFVKPLIRSMASCCQGLAGVRWDCKPRIFCCNAFTSTLIFSNAAECVCQLKPLF